MMKRSALFSERKRLEREFLEWAKEKRLGICPFNVVTWLLCIKGYKPPKEDSNETD